MAECLFLFGVGFDDDGVLGRWFVFFVGFVASRLAACANVVSLDSVAQLATQDTAVQCRLVAHVHRVLDDRQTQRDARMLWWSIDLDLFIHREQLNDPQSHQSPVQFHIAAFRRTTVQRAATECLLERAERKFDSPTHRIQFGLP